MVSTVTFHMQEVYPIGNQSSTLDKTVPRHHTPTHTHTMTQTATVLAHVFKTKHQQLVYMFLIFESVLKSIHLNILLVTVDYKLIPVTKPFSGTPYFPNRDQVIPGNQHEEFPER